MFLQSLNIYDVYEQGPRRGQMFVENRNKENDPAKIKLTSPLVPLLLKERDFFGILKAFIS
jgi:hypothetical protein